MKPNDIIKELEEMGSPLAGMSRVMPYAVPEGYFGLLSSEITAQLFQTNTAVSIDTKEMPFDIPQGYFQSLPEQILKAAKEADALADLPRTMPFAMPAGYFENLPEQMLKAAKRADESTGKKTKVISFGGRIGKTLRWAAAAVLLMGIGVGSYKMLTPDTVNPGNTLASVSNDAISEYVDQNFTDMDPEVRDMSVASNAKELENLNEEEIESYLNETGWEETL